MPLTEPCTITVIDVITKLTPAGSSSYNSTDLKHDQRRSCVHIIPGYLENPFYFFLCPGCSSADKQSWKRSKPLEENNC